MYVSSVWISSGERARWMELLKAATKKSRE